MTEADEKMITFAIIDKTKPASPEDDEEPPGMVSYMSPSLAHLSTEIGFIIVLQCRFRGPMSRATRGQLPENDFLRLEEGALG